MLTRHEYLYALAVAGGDAPLEAIYGRFDDLLAEGRFAEVDALLSELSPRRLGAEAVIAVLIATMPAKDDLRNRAAFIESAREVLGKEPEGLEAMLDGLV